MKKLGKDLTKSNLTSTMISTDFNGNISNFPYIDASRVLICELNKFGRAGMGEYYICETLNDMQQLQGQYNSGFAIQIKWFTMPKPQEVPTQVDITGLDKAEVLLALVKNAKNSPHVKQVLAEFPIQQNVFDGFTIEEARNILAKSNMVDFVETVSIKVDFSSDTIFVKTYNDSHAPAPDQGCLNAHEVIEALRKTKNSATSSSVSSTSITACHTSPSPVTMFSSKSKDKLSFDQLVLAIKGDIHELTKLLDTGFDVNTPNEYGVTLLIVAASNNRVETVKFLLSRGADSSIQNRHGVTALELAEQGNHSEVVSLLTKKVTVEDKGSTVNNFAGMQNGFLN